MLWVADADSTCRSWLCAARKKAFLRMVFVALAVVLLTGVAHAVTLGIDGSQFTLDGKPAFLLGVSYYGALSAPREFIREDLDDLSADGWNWIRVWATWRAGKTNVSVVDEAGRARELYLAKLIWLVREADRRGMVVDVTFAHGEFLPSLDAHLKAVRVLARALKPFRNVYFDLANERDVRDARYVSFQDLRKLRDEVKRIDPQRLLTASGDRDPRDYLLTAGLDFFSPHLGRNANSPAKTEGITRGYLKRMKELGHVAPVHYQEPFRRDYARWQPAAEDFLRDLRGALAGGAAGWCLHNGGPRGGHTGRPRCFDMGKGNGRLLDQLDKEETTVLRAAPGLVREAKQHKPSDTE